METKYIANRVRTQRNDINLRKYEYAVNQDYETYMSDCKNTSHSEISVDYVPEEYVILLRAQRFRKTINTDIENHKLTLRICLCHVHAFLNRRS